MRGVRRRRRAGSDDGAGGRSPAETLVELAGRPLPGPPHDPFRLSDDDDHLIGGYRVLRLLGRGSRADVYLGRLPAWAAPAAATTTTAFATADAGSGADLDPDAFGLPAEVALKVFPRDTDPGSIDRELAALSAAVSPHVVRLLDVARLADGPVCLLLGRCDGGSLSALLDERRSIRAGEAVTVLAPVLEGLASMHRAGFTHGGLRLSSVLFDGTGAPVLTGWGHGVGLLDDRGRPPGPGRLAATPAVVADLRRFAMVADAVLARVEGGARLAAALRAETERGSADTAERLADALFDFAEPLPVALAPPGGAGPSTSGRSGAVLAAEERQGRTTGRHRSVTAGVPDGHPRDALARIRAGSRRVRRPVWVAAGLAVAAAVLTAALLLMDAAPAAESPDGPVSLPASAAASTPAPAAPAPEVTESADAVALQAAIAGDDPVAAAAGLLRLRAECIRLRSAACLDGVDQPGSVALSADLAEVERAGGPHAAVGDGITAGPAPGAPEPSGPPGPPGHSEGDPPVLVERMGGTAIVAVPAALLGAAGPDTPTASLLMIRSEAGWRIRDVL